MSAAHRRTSWSSVSALWVKCLAADTSIGFPPKAARSSISRILPAIVSRRAVQSMSLSSSIVYTVSSCVSPLASAAVEIFRPLALSFPKGALICL